MDNSLTKKVLQFFQVKTEPNIITSDYVEQNLTSRLDGLSYLLKLLSEQKKVNPNSLVLLSSVAETLKQDSEHIEWALDDMNEIIEEV